MGVVFVSLFCFVWRGSEVGFGGVDFEIIRCAELVICLGLVLGVNCDQSRMVAADCTEPFQTIGRPPTVFHCQCEVLLGSGCFEKEEAIPSHEKVAIIASAPPSSSSRNDGTIHATSLPPHTPPWSRYLEYPVCWRAVCPFLHKVSCIVIGKDCMLIV